LLADSDDLTSKEESGSLSPKSNSNVQTVASPDAMIVVLSPPTTTTPTPATPPFPATPRLVVETTADVDALDDGYNWRKYGQKKVKGAFERSYYKCTEEDCVVKKQVEHRDNTILNTYEGTHNHVAPGLEDGVV
jgi:hypothetical protein